MAIRPGSPLASLHSLWETPPRMVGGLRRTGPWAGVGSVRRWERSDLPQTAALPRPHGHGSNRVLPSHARGPAHTCPFRYRWKWPLHLGLGRGLWDRGDPARPPILVITRGVCL